MKGGHGIRRVAYWPRQQRRQGQQLPFNVLVRYRTASDVWMFIQISGVDFTGLKTLVAENTPKERGIGLTSQQDEVVYCTARAPDDLASVRSVHDDFGQHRIKCGRNGLTLGDAAIHTHTVTLRVFQRQHFPRRRREIALGGFRIKSDLDRMAIGSYFVLPESKWMSRRNGNLFCNQIQSGYHLGNRMLNLQAGVHLKEVKLSTSVNEFHRAGVAVSSRACDASGSLANLFPGVSREGRRRRFLDDLLETPLHRTFPFEQVYDISEGITENLNLDMSWPFHKPLGIQSPVAEIALPFAPRLRHRIVKLGKVANNAHALAASSGRWLDDKRRTDRPGTVKKCVGIVFLDSRWCDWESTARDKVAGPDLVPHELDHVSGRTDKNKPGGLDRAREDRIFGEETIAGVNRTGCH
jgi:hypothetical protein